MTKTSIFTPEHDAVLAEAREGGWEVEVVWDSGFGHLHAVLVNNKNQDVLELSTAPTTWTATSTHGTFVFDTGQEDLQKWDSSKGISVESWAKALRASSTPLRQWCHELFQEHVEDEVERYIKTRQLDHTMAEQLRDRVAEDVLVWSENESAAMDAADNFSWDGGSFVLFVHAVECYDYRYNTDFFWTLEVLCWMSQKLNRRF